jgi:hypothetical protein
MMAAKLVNASQLGLTLRPGSPRAMNGLAAFGLDLRGDRRFVRPCPAIRAHVVQLVADTGVGFHPAVVFFPRLEPGARRDECA